MTSLEPYEIEAAAYAASMAAEYLESIGKTDLALLTAPEWELFCHTFAHNLLTKRAELEPCPF